MKVYEIFLKNGKSYILGADTFTFRNGKVYFDEVTKYADGAVDSKVVACFEEHSIVGFVAKNIEL